METKQTAVEYLVEQLKRIGFSTNNLIEFENEVIIAKAMEKEQIIDAVDGFPLQNRNLDGEQYYNETYKEII
jgi:hypothetical protein